MNAHANSSGRTPGRVRALLSQNGLALALIALIIFFSILRPQSFPTLGNFGSILQANSPIAFIALGFLIPLVVGHFDLSVAAMAAFSGMVAARLFSDGVFQSWVPVLAIILVLACIVGAISGVLVSYVGLNSLVVTLGVQSVLFGAVLWYSKGAVVYQGIPENLLWFGQARPGGIPVPFLFVIVAAIVLWYVLYYRPIGRQLYAIGGSEDAARLTGIRVRPLVLGSFVVAAVLSSIGGFLQTAQVGSSAPSSGSEFLLPAIAACFLGETSVRRGFYNVWGTVIAVFLIAIGTTGLFMLGARSWVQPVFQGVVLLGAVLVAKITASRMARAATVAEAEAETIAAEPKVPNAVN